MIRVEEFHLFLHAVVRQIHTSELDCHFSSSSMSHHRHSTGLLLKCPSYVNHQGTPPTSPVSPTDPAQFHHLQVPPGNQTLPTNVSSVRAHMPLIRYRSEPLRDEEPLSPDGSMPPSESSLGDTQGSEYLASSFSSYSKLMRFFNIDKSYI